MRKQNVHSQSCSWYTVQSTCWSKEWLCSFIHISFYIVHILLRRFVQLSIHSKSNGQRRPHELLLFNSNSNPSQNVLSYCPSLISKGRRFVKHIPNRKSRLFYINVLNVSAGASGDSFQVTYICVVKMTWSFSNLPSFANRIRKGFLVVGSPILLFYKPFPVP